ncbi:MAG: hypothetical protein R6X25_00635 [Candidatus Krumholzibacteriia bacterium]
MKRFTIAVSLLALMMATGALAGPPLNGSYDSTDMGGPAFIGRYTEGWDASGSALDAGTTLNAASWDGMVLGSQWRYWCGTETSSVLLTSTVNSAGNGNATYMKTFVGGYIWLSGDGPWGNGDPEYTGTINSYNEFETITYSEWVPIAAVTNVQANAFFDGYPELCMAFYIGNGTRIATTEIGEVIPADYPDLLDPDCAATRTLGAAWDFTSVTLTIDGCVVSAVDATWSSVKSLYND